MRFYCYLLLLLLLLTVPQELPRVIDGGQDPVPNEPQITEEEFDLSDIMGEQLDAQVETKEERLQQLEKQVKTCAYSKSCGIVQDEYNNCQNFCVTALSHADRAS